MYSEKTTLLSRVRRSLKAGSERQADTQQLVDIDCRSFETEANYSDLNQPLTQYEIDFPMAAFCYHYETLQFYKESFQHEDLGLTRKNTIRWYYSKQAVKCLALLEQRETQLSQDNTTMPQADMFYLKKFITACARVESLIGVSSPDEIFNAISLAVDAIKKINRLNMTEEQNIDYVAVEAGFIRNVYTTHINAILSMGQADIQITDSQREMFLGVLDDISSRPDLADDFTGFIKMAPLRNLWVKMHPSSRYLPTYPPSALANLNGSRCVDMWISS